MKKIILAFLLLFSSLQAGIPVDGKYPSPTKRLIERETWPRIEKYLKNNNLPSELISFLDEIAEHEDWGHIGYHGALQEYRVYQDIIRITVEEILALPVREDFHFLRVPGDTALNLDDFYTFSKYWGEVNNKNDTRMKQLLSMNYGVYSNFDEKGSCSIYLFSDDASKHEIDYRSQLAPFYQKLGISTKSLKKLFAIGKNSLQGEGGILLQISENSHLTDPNDEAYNLADKLCYPCKKGGYLYGTSSISNHFARIMMDEYLTKDINTSPQLRLLINNRYTLNPMSHLTIRRYDLYDKETVANYETELRTAIRSLKYDPILVDIYQRKLLKKWTNQ